MDIAVIWRENFMLLSNYAYAWEAQSNWYSTKRHRQRFAAPVNSTGPSAPHLCARAAARKK